MKKILSIIIALLCLPSTVYASDLRGDFLDPFNNDLFEVVAETSYYHEYDYAFDNYETIYSDDYSTAKVVRTHISYTGEVIKTDLCDFVAPEVAESYIPEPSYGYTNKNSYNDGIIAASVDYSYYSVYKDVTGTAIYTPASESYFTYDYNMGLLSEGENNGWAGPYMTELEHKTTFTKVMTDNTKYEFHCLITPFNNDGYALMRANDKTYIVKLKAGVIPTVSYNGEKIAFDQIPVIENGRTLVPLRAIFEKLGAEVSWNDATKTVTAVKDGTAITLTIDSTSATKNGEAVTLDVPATIINGRTMVPVRFIADCFGVSVSWDAKLLRVSLTA